MAGNEQADKPPNENGSPKRSHHDAKLLRLILRRRFAKDPEYQQFGKSPTDSELADYLFRVDAEPHAPEDVFEKLRWGGQFIYISENWKEIVDTVNRFAEWHGAKAWALEKRPVTEKRYRFGFPLFGAAKPLYYFIARKVMLVAPGQSSERFTYHVYLERNRDTGEFEVVKEVPNVERVLARLKQKFPEADEETLRRRAKKFTEKVFPVFLTREAAILKLLHRDLPKQYHRRVPKVLYAEQDLLGYVRTLRMNWLRNALPEIKGKKRQITQLEFAHQAAELLAALHDQAKVMHLDLRLDNVVITRRGVGFVDFGSAVRVGEDFPEASLLGSLFGEMMRTSQIQRMLGKMTESGQVTSEEITSSYHRIDKAVDFFYLAVQINAPLSNPDFRGLVKFEKNCKECKALAALTDKILRPEDPTQPEFKSAQDILTGIEAIEKKLH